MTKKQNAAEPKLFCKDCSHRVNNATEACAQNKNPGYCFVKNTFRKRKDETCESLSQRGLALVYVKEQTEAVCIAAAKENGYALQYAPRPKPPARKR